MNDGTIRTRTAGATALIALVALCLAGCRLATGTPAPSVSIYKGTVVPIQYGLSTGNGVVNVSVDRSKEGVVLGAALDEYEMPTSWAKVAFDSVNYYLYDKQVDPIVADAASFVLAGSAYYAKKIQLGADAGAKTFTATVSGSSVVFTYTSTTETISLPDAALSAANQKWYWDQMAAGNYFVVDSAGAEFTPVDYTKVADGSAAFAGATKINRWLKSANDIAWKSGRDAALAFCMGKILIGADAMSMTKSSNKWIMGIDDTLVADTWSFDTYVRILLNAYKGQGAVVDVVSSASR